VPPYLRLVEPSACWKASKIICCFSGGIPMPVSLTLNAITFRARFNDSLSLAQPSVAMDMFNETMP
jgi:hypothetical protein